jgi:hypothetical protein
MLAAILPLAMTREAFMLLIHLRERG